MGIRILSDENCHGQVEAVFNELDQLGYVELLEVYLLTWDEAQLATGVDDETIWRFCQDNNCLLLTGNRTGDDDTESLEHITRTLIRPDSLPVLTFGNLKRVIPDRNCTVVGHVHRESLTLSSTWRTIGVYLVFTHLESDSSLRSVNR